MAALPEATAWGLDPLFWAHPELFAQQVHELSREPTRCCDHCLYGVRPLSRAAVMGLVVAKDLKVNKCVYLVDDGTNIVQCILFFANVDKTWMRRRNALPEQEALLPNLGDLVRAHGVLRIDSQFLHDSDAPRGPTPAQTAKKHFVAGVSRKRWRVLYADAVLRVEDPNQELLHWLQVMDKSEKVYSRPAHHSLHQTWTAHMSESGATMGGSQAVPRGSLQGLSPVAQDGFAKAVMKAMTDAQEKADDSSPCVWTLPQLLAIEDLWADAIQRAGLPRESLTQCLGALLVQLCEQGKVYKIGLDRYGLVDMRRIVIPAIVVRLAKFDNARGITLDQLLESIRADPRCSKLSAQKLAKGLAVLQEGGHVQLVRRGVFRLCEARSSVQKFSESQDSTS